jgi:CubicO group peptidase (beta-lactamase class C family)
MQKTGKSEVDLPLVFDPGERWAYGPSTRVLGDVIEAVSAQKLDVFLESHILQPLGMHDTSYLVPKAKYPRVVGVNRRGPDGKFVEGPMPDTLPATVAGDAGLYGTAGDYGFFLRMLLNHGKLGSTRILSDKSAKTLFENHTAGVVVMEQQSINPGLSNNFPVGVGKDHWGLGFQLAAEPPAESTQPRERIVGRCVQHALFPRSEEGDRGHRHDADAAVLRRCVDEGLRGCRGGCVQQPEVAT